MTTQSACTGDVLRSAVNQKNSGMISVSVCKKNALKHRKYPNGNKDSV